MINIKADHTLFSRYPDLESYELQMTQWLQDQAKKFRKYTKHFDDFFSQTASQFLAFLRHCAQLFFEEHSWSLIPGMGMMTKMASIAIFLGLMAFVVHFSTFLTYCALLFATSRCILEILSISCQGAAWLVSVYVSFYHAHKIPHPQLLVDQKLLSQLESDLSLNVSEALKNHNSLEGAFRACENLQAHSADVLRQKIVQAFPRHEQSFKDRLCVLFQAQRDDALQILSQHINTISLDDFSALEPDSWDEFFQRYSSYHDYKTRRDFLIHYSDLCLLLNLSAKNIQTSPPLFKNVFIEKLDTWTLRRGGDEKKLRDYTNRERAEFYTDLFIAFFKDECGSVGCPEDNSPILQWEYYLHDLFNTAFFTQDSVEHDRPPYTFYWDQNIKDAACTLVQYADPNEPVHVSANDLQEGNESSKAKLKQ